MLHASVTALLEALAAIEAQIARLDEQLKELARRSPVCWRFARGITSGKGRLPAGEQQTHVWDV
jgi:hypothetical protein